MRLLAGTLLSLAVGCAGPDKAPEFERMAAREIAAHPEWYSFGESRAVLIVRDGVPRGLIWGTMHVDYDSDTVLPRPIRDRFAEASSLSVEYDLGRMSQADRQKYRRQFQDAMAQPDPAALARLDPQTRAALDAAGLPPGSVSRHSLLGLSRLVSARASRGVPRPTLPTIDVVDGLLARFARNRGIPVHSLEDAGQPLDVSYDGDPNGPDAARELRAALRCAGDTRDFARWLKAAYARGRVAEMSAAAYGFCSEPSDAATLAAYRTRLLTRRNAVMADRIEAVLAEPGFHFVAIGAAHLLGTDGVPALLHARGWTVTPCPEDRC